VPTRERPLPDSKPGKYETSTAIDIMKLYCLDVGSLRVIARMSGTDLKYVRKTIKYWEENHSYTVGELRRFFMHRVHVA
jgi:hypothetical protein